MGIVQWLFAKRTPGFLVSDFDRDGALDFRRRENREKIEWFGAGIERAVNNTGREINGIARSHDALFFFNPLLRSARKDVENFLHLGMVMEIVGLTGRQL